MRDWHFWFLQLSGWPVFLAIVGLTFLFMLLASVVMPWLSQRSIRQNMFLAWLAIAALAFGLLGLIAVLSRL